MRRAHLRQGIDTVSLQMAVRACQGLLRRYIELHGADALIPKRKEPLTNDIIRRLLAMPDGTSLGPRRRLEWRSERFVALRAIYATLAQTGMRKAEVALGPTSPSMAMYISLWRTCVG